jgi:glucokinase
MAIGRSVEEAIARNETTTLRPNGAGIDAAALAAAAAGGDAVAARILAETGEHLGRGISFLLNVLNPEMIVLGGSVAAAGEALLREVRASVGRHALLPEGVAIVPSALGDKAELTGAVLLAMEASLRSVRIVGG